MRLHPDLQSSPVQIFFTPSPKGQAEPCYALSHSLAQPADQHTLRRDPEASKCQQKRRWREQHSQPAVRTIEEKAAAFWESDQSGPYLFFLHLTPIHLTDFLT